MLFPFIFLLILTGCRSQTPWTTDRISSGQSKFNSTKLAYTAEDPINGLDLEFLKIQDTLYAYLNVHSVPIPPLKKGEGNGIQYSAVYITIGPEKHRFEAIRREGGQRLLLPNDAADLILSSLKKELPVGIAVSGYSSLVTPSDFAKQYKKIEKNHTFKSPFHSPF